MTLLDKHIADCEAAQARARRALNVLADAFVLNMVDEHGMSIDDAENRVAELVADASNNDPDIVRLFAECVKAADKMSGYYAQGLSDYRAARAALEAALEARHG